MNKRRDYRKVEDTNVTEIHSESKPNFKGNSVNIMTFRKEDEMEDDTREIWGDYEVEILPPEPEKLKVQLINSNGEKIAILTAWEEYEDGRPIIKVTSDGEIDEEDFQNTYAEIMKQFYNYKNADYINNPNVSENQPKSIDDIDLSEFEDPEKEKEKKGFLGLGKKDDKDDKGFLGLGKKDKKKKDKKKDKDKKGFWDT